MPHKIVRPPGSTRSRTLGWLALWWIETFVVHGPGDVQGEPVRHGDEYSTFVVDCYALDADGGRLVDSAFFSRPKGCDKSGLGSRLVLFEALGPCRFAGWAQGGETYTFLGQTYTYEKGEPMGKPVNTPYVRILATEEGQPLALDTPVATPQGWTTVDALQVGDAVFDSRGRPTSVQRVTRVMTDLDCYEVVFSDGEAIVASGSHCWTVEKRQLGSGVWVPTTTTTEQMATDYHSDYRGKRYRIPLTPALELPALELLVDPYFLGLWLGDGKTADSSVVFDAQDEEDMRREIAAVILPGEEAVWSDEGGWGTVRIRREGGRKHLHTLRNRLRDLGVLGAKHIPAVYLRASREQRFALLQGLMDSDGTIDTGKGRAGFVNTNRNLIDGIEELLTSLGYKWDERETPKTSSWRVAFQPSSNEPPFRLTRKRDRVQPDSPARRSRHRHVVEVRKVNSVPVKCIGIDTPDHLFAAGRRMVLTHNTGNVYDTIYFNLTDGPLAELKAYGLDCGLTRVALPYGGEITPSTAGASSKDGGKETFVVADESHLYNTKALREMHSTVTRNLVKRKKSAGTWYLETTTMYLPGEESVAEATYKYMQLVEESMQAVANGKKPKLRGRIRMLFDHRWSDLVDLSDEQKLAEAVAEAYGEAMDWNSLEGVVDKIFDPRTTPSESRRYYLNALTEASNAWLTPAEIARVSDGMPVKMGGCLRKGDRIALGFDGAQTNDATALVACRIEDGTVDPLLIIEKPDGPEAEDWRVDEVAVDAAVAHAFAEYQVEAFFADPPHWQDRIDAWELEYGERLAVKAGHDAIRWWTKRDAPMALALERFHLNLTATENGAPVVRMSANPVFVRHMTNARRWPRRGGVVIGKEGKNSVRKMDAAMAATLAFEARARVLAGGEAPEDDFVPFKVGARPSPPAAGERGRLARRAALRQRLASMQ